MSEEMARTGSPPQITVVIPVRNRRALLERALRSVAKQDFTDFEVIVVDDGSDEPLDDLPGTVGLDRIKVLVQAPLGAGWARNAGARAASGVWITFLDSDDEADEKWLSTLHELARSSQARLVFCGSRTYSGASEVGAELPRNPHFMAGPPVNFRAGAFMLESTLFHAVGGYDAAFPAAQHTELGIRLLDRSKREGWKTASTDEPLLSYHLQNAGGIRSDMGAVAGGAVAIIDKHGDLLRAAPRELANYAAVAGVSLIKAGFPVARARPYLRMACRVQPRSLKHWARWLVSLFPPLARRTWERRSSTQRSAESASDSR